MALNAGTTWEVRITGAQTNGGGFYDRTPGTSVNYSQQDAAQLTLTDLAVSTTAISSVTGGFTDAMEGNICYITGGGATAGWYEITAVADSNNATIDRTAGTGTNSTINVGGAWLLGGALDDEFLSTMVAGNKVWAEIGTYTAGEVISTGNGSGTTGKIVFEGYNATRGDAPTLTNRPTIALGANTLTFGDYWDVENFIFTGTGTVVVSGSLNTRFINCKATNSSGTAGRIGFSSDASVTYIKCEAISTLGYAINGTLGGSSFMCHIHDSANGILNGGSQSIIGCIIETCSASGIVSAANTGLVFGCTIYGCGTGIATATHTGYVVTNTIISGCTTGASCNAGYQNSHFYDYNVFNNTTDRSNVLAGDHDVDADPLLNDPDNGDFSLKAGSPCLDAGMQPDTTIGIV
jgi:hypothetical protein